MKAPRGTSCTRASGSRPWSSATTRTALALQLEARLDAGRRIVRALFAADAAVNAGAVASCLVSAVRHGRRRNDRSDERDPQADHRLSLWGSVCSHCAAYRAAGHGTGGVGGTGGADAGTGDAGGAGGSAPDECGKIFAETGVCPSDRCLYGGGENWPWNCVQKPCFQFTPADCPSQWSCEVMPTCSGSDVCRKGLSQPPPRCGPVGYYGQDVPCCPALVKRCGAPKTDGTCDPAIGSQGMFAQCLACGDQKCGQNENKCNCPEDCGGAT